jgi:hypothetical protein
LNPRRTDAERDEQAVALAEVWWPGRYVGDLTGTDWRNLYDAVDDYPPAGPTDKEKQDG